MSRPRMRPDYAATMRDGPAAEFSSPGVALVSLPGYRAYEGTTEIGRKRGWQTL
jgi:hypothetical protein